jgi:hypothetical protein
MSVPHRTGKKVHNTVCTPRVLLIPDQFEKLAAEFVDQLHSVPLYDVHRKRALASEYFRKVQTIIVDNICALPDDNPNSVKSVIALDLLAE